MGPCSRFLVSEADVRIRWIPYLHLVLHPLAGPKSSGARGGRAWIEAVQLDVERASWAAETALEWRREEGTPMPDALIQGVTRDLFKFQHRSSDPDLTAADQLASAILGTASSLNVDTGVAKIQLDRKDLRRLQKTDAKEAD